jgi:phosphatidylglycerol:prolipoprotein diacylglycerol transferase
MINQIGFPALNLTFSVDRVAFTVFGREIYWYAICILSGYLLGLLFVTKTCKRRGVNPDDIFDISFWGLIISIICARIYYCIFDWKEIGGFWGIFKIWEGGIAIYGALIGAISTAYFICKKRKLSTLNVFDVFVPGLLIGQIIGRWGNFFNCEVYGHETNSIFAMTINGGNGVHPLFLYEGVWNFLGLLLILIFRDKKHENGQVFFFYIFWYSLGRLFLEGMRNSEYILYVIPNVLGISQVVAFFGIILGIFASVFLAERKKM